MMGGALSATFAGIWPFLVVFMVLVLASALVLFGAWRTRAGGAAPARSPEEVLRDRYAREELSQRQYRDTLVDILKDRYVRGELELEEVREDAEPAARRRHQPSGGRTPLGTARVIAACLRP
jgi:uncharacterized membrane protein